ncbi:MAG: hypothetical protein MAGBODY4_01331 [Candidatus Marinimicrobia bacterium]|nr:hypothetical protein [Candidatus Neomarinimicrobiota bacterium]
MEDTTSLYTFVDDEVKPPVKKAYILYDRNGDRLGPLKFRQENVYLEAMYGNGAYIGRTDTGKLHIVHLGQDIYKVVDVLAAGEEYYCPTYGCTGGGAFIETTEDMLFEYPKRKNGKIMSDFYLISKNGEILWKRSYNGEVVYNVLSPDGSYVALMYTIPVQKETWDEPRIVPFEGEVEIIRRDGTTVSTFQTGFSSSRDQFSQDNEYILFREQHQVIKIFAVQTGELVNRILFPGSRPVEEVVLNKPLGVIAVLRNVTSGWGGERRITVVPIEGTAKRPVWEYSLGEFDRRSDDFSHFTHLSISHDGSEISVLSNKKYLRFERVE